MLKTMRTLLSKIKKKINYLIKYRLYVNETLLLFKNEKHTNQKSPASIAYITPDNVKDVLYFQPPRYIPIFEDFLMRGDTGYFAYLDGNCVHRIWGVHSSPQIIYLHPMLPRQLKENEVWIHYVETAPHARGRNIFPAVLSKIAEDFDEDGLTLLFAVNEKNTSCIKAALKAGFREVEKQKVLVLFGIKRTKFFRC
jgi:GNAT superfamily N-acetyltransferase